MSRRTPDDEPRDLGKIDFDGKLKPIIRNPKPELTLVEVLARIDQTPRRDPAGLPVADPAADLLIGKDEDKLSRISLDNIIWSGESKGNIYPGTIKSPVTGRTYPNTAEGRVQMRQEERAELDLQDPFSKFNLKDRKEFKRIKNKLSLEMDRDGIVD